MCVVMDNRNPQDRNYQNLTNVYYFLAEMCKTVNGKMPMELYLKNLPDDHPAKGLLAIADVAPSRTKGSFYTAALTTLRLYTNPLIYDMTCKSDFKLSDVGKEKTAVYIILPDERTTYYPLASLLVNQIYTALVQEADSRGGRLARRANFILDEFGNFLKLPDFGAKLSVGAGRGLRFYLFLQGICQLDDKYGREIASIIKANCQAWIYLQANDMETLEEVSKKLGKYTTSTYSLGSSTARYSAPSGSQNMSLIGRELLMPDEVRRIQRPYILLITQHHPAMMTAPDISQYRFNALFGMGEPEHNRLLRAERASKRAARNIVKDMQLWNIWKFYSAQLENSFQAQMMQQAFQQNTKKEVKNTEKNEKKEGK